MLKRGVFALSLFAASAIAQAAAPTADQVKEALYERYATAQGAQDLQKALETEVAVGVCEPQAENYRCLIENKALGTSIPMVFAYDATTKKWKFVKEEAK